MIEIVPTDSKYLPQKNTQPCCASMVQGAVAIDLPLLQRILDLLSIGFRDVSKCLQGHGGRNPTWINNPSASAGTTR